MITLKPQVYAALRAAAPPGWRVHYAHPGVGAQLPCVSYYESGNSDYARADGQEHLTEITYQVDFWSDDPDQNDMAIALADAALSVCGLKRTFSADMFENSGIHHKTARYRCVTDGAYIYQG